MPSEAPDGPGTFAAVLRQAREAAGLGQAELADLAHMSVRALRYLEHGHVRGPQRRSAEHLATALRLEGSRRESFLRLAAAGRTPRPLKAGPEIDPPATPEGGCLLPARTADLSGRETELAGLRSLAVEVTRAGTGSGAVAVIHGLPGVGKTALAVELATVLGDVFPDGSLFVDLRGTDEQPMSVQDVLGRVISALGVHAGSSATTAEERSDVLRSVLSKRRVLLVLDNAANEGQVRLLLPSGTQSAAVITSRRVLPGLVGVRHWPLDVLSADHSVILLRRIVGSERVDAEPEAAIRLVQLSAHLPLALRIVGNRLAVRPGWDLAHLVSRLADEGNRLSVLATGDLAVRAACHLSYRLLTSELQRFFRHLAFIPGAEFGVDLAAAAAGVESHSAEDLLETLADHNLLHLGSTPGRYRIHDLLRLFAREQLLTEEPPASVLMDEDRIIRWLVARATRAGAVLDTELISDVTSSIADWSNHRASEFAWLEREHEHWLQAIRVAAERHWHEDVLGFVRVMNWYADESKFLLPWEEIFGYAVTAARAIGDETSEALALNYLGWAQLDSGAVERAAITFGSAKALAQRIGDVEGQAWADGFLSRVMIELGRPQEAAELARTALELTGPDTRFIVRNYAQQSLAKALSAMGKHEEALILLLDSVDRLRHSSGLVPDLAFPGVAFTLHLAANCHAALERWPEALTALVEARQELTKVGARVPRWKARAASMLFDEGLVRYQLGDAENNTFFQEALLIFHQLDDVNGQIQARAALARSES